MLHTILAARVPTVHVGPELQEVAAHQLVEPFMPGRVLDKARLITEAVVTIVAQAVKVALVVSVAAHRKLAVLVEAELQVARRNSFVLGEAAAAAGIGGDCAADWGTITVQLRCTFIRFARTSLFGRVKGIPVAWRRTI